MEELPARSGHPLVELRSMPDREPCEEARNIGGDRAGRLLSYEALEVTDVAINRCLECYDRTLRVNDFAEGGAEMLQSLAK
jgi:hypothetical protein